MPPARNSIPAMFVDAADRFGRRDRATYPHRVASAPTLTAAAWAQHELVQALRVWVVTEGFSTPNAWITGLRLSKTKWGRIIRGEQWVSLEDLAFLARQFGEPAQAQVARLASSLNGQNLPQAPVAAAGRRAPQRMSASTARERARNGLGKAGAPPETAVDSLWVALTDLAEREGVATPSSILIWEGDEPSLWGEAGGDASVTLLFREGPPLPFVDGYCVLGGEAVVGQEVVVADLLLDAEEGLIFRDRRGIVTTGNRLDWVS